MRLIIAIATFAALPFHCWAEGPPTGISEEARSAPAIFSGDHAGISAHSFASNADGPEPITSSLVPYKPTPIAPPQTRQRTQTRSIGLGSPAPQNLQGLNTSAENDAVGRIYRPAPQLSGAAVGDLLVFETPSGAREHAQIIRAEVTQYGNYLVQAQSDESEMLAVVTEDGNFISRVTGPSGVFQSQILEGNTVVYSGTDDELVDNPFINDVLVHEFPASQSYDIEPEELSADPTVISVGVLYDNATRYAYDEIALAEYYVYVANLSYQASGVDIEFEIVGTRNYEPYISNSSLGETLRYITCGTTSCDPGASYNSSVQTWRGQVKADLVVQLVRYGVSIGQGTQCGIAWVPTTAGDFLYRLSLLTYSVNAIESRAGSACGDIVVAHEMGHNLGLVHDRETDAGSTFSPYYSYARGYKINSIYGTVMSYSPLYVAALSTPYRTFNGLPVGVPIGQENEAFAAQAVANVMSIYEGIYDNTTPTYHTVTANAGYGGSISPASVNVLEGSTTSFTVTPDSTVYGISATGCNGSLSGYTYTTGAITAPCTVTANFDIPPTPPLSAPPRPDIIRTGFGDGEIYLYLSSSSPEWAITGYTATCSDGVNSFAGTSTSSPITVSGLANEVAYTCTVTAENSVGTSPASATTARITPEATAGLPIWLIYQATQ